MSETIKIPVAMLPKKKVDNGVTIPVSIIDNRLRLANGFMIGSTEQTEEGSWKAYVFNYDGAVEHGVYTTSELVMDALLTHFGVVKQKPILEGVDISKPEAVLNALMSRLPPCWKTRNWDGWENGIAHIIGGFMVGCYSNYDDKNTLNITIKCDKDGATCNFSMGSKDPFNDDDDGDAVETTWRPIEWLDTLIVM